MNFPVGKAAAFLAAGLCLGMLALPAKAADWPEISPADLAMTGLPEQPGAAAVVLLHEESADDTNNVHSLYMRIKILTDAGRR